MLPIGFLANRPRVLCHVAVEIEYGLHTWIFAGLLSRGYEPSRNIKAARGHHAHKEVRLFQGMVEVGETGRHHLVNDGALRRFEGIAELGDEFVGGDGPDGVEKRGLVLEVTVGETPTARVAARIITASGPPSRPSLMAS